MIQGGVGRLYWMLGVEFGKFNYSFSTHDFNGGFGRRTNVQPTISMVDLHVGFACRICTVDLHGGSIKRKNPSNRFNDFNNKHYGTFTIKKLDTPSLFDKILATSNN